MSKEAQEKDVRIHKADMALQARIGTGPLNEETVERCQKVIDNNNVDFAPLALEYLDKLETAVKAIKTDNISMQDSVESITAPVMQLKANASTFHYSLIGALANVMLSFLESIKTLDDDALAIISAHHQTLKIIVTKKMAGDGGPLGKKMQQELQNACERYFAKRK